MSAGFGHAYGGTIGAQFRYDLVFRSGLHVAPFAAGGLFTNSRKSEITGAAGVSVSLGHRHRLAMDAEIAPLYMYLLSLHGTVVDGRVAFGPGAGVGYEHVSDAGYFQHVTIGYAYTTFNLHGEPPRGATLISLGLGGRIW